MRLLFRGNSSRLAIYLFYTMAIGSLSSVSAASDIVLLKPPLIVKTIKSNFVGNRPNDCGYTNTACMGGYQEAPSAMKQKFESTLRKSGLTILGSPPTANSYYEAFVTLTFNDVPPIGKHCELTAVVRIVTQGDKDNKDKKIRAVFPVPRRLQVNSNDSSMQADFKLREIATRCLDGVVTKLKLNFGSS